MSESGEIGPVTPQPKTEVIPERKKSPGTRETVKNEKRIIPLATSNIQITEWGKKLSPYLDGLFEVSGGELTHIGFNLGLTSANEVVLDPKVSLSAGRGGYFVTDLEGNDFQQNERLPKSAIPTLMIGPTGLPITCVSYKGSGTTVEALYTRYLAEGGMLRSRKDGRTYPINSVNKITGDQILDAMTVDVEKGTPIGLLGRKEAEKELEISNKFLELGGRVAPVLAIVDLDKNKMIDHFTQELAMESDPFQREVLQFWIKNVGDMKDSPVILIRGETVGGRLADIFDPTPFSRFKESTLWGSSHKMGSKLPDAPEPHETGPFSSQAILDRTISYYLREWQEFTSLSDKPWEEDYCQRYGFTLEEFGYYQDIFKNYLSLEEDQRHNLFQEEVLHARRGVIELAAHFWGFNRVIGEYGVGRIGISPRPQDSIPTGLVTDFEESEGYRTHPNEEPKYPITVDNNGYDRYFIYTLLPLAKELGVDRYFPDTRYDSKIEQSPSYVAFKEGWEAGLKLLPDELKK
jgi:hypothetical protein